MTKWGHLGMKFLFRACIGMAVIYGINYVMDMKNIEYQVGYNLVSLLTCGTLGIPGVGLLYGITISQIL